MNDPRWELTIEREDVVIGCHVVGPGQYSVGRASASSISIKVGPVSRNHARLTVTSDGALEVEDLGSANGTLIDNVAIQGTTRWHPGQVLTIGDTHLRAHTADPEAAITLSDSNHAAANPITPASPSPISPLSTYPIDGPSDDLLRRHLPLTSREAQRYDLGSELARGGMGAVMQAKESATRRTVAMKVMLSHDNTRDTVRFIEEAQVTAQLEHPNIVPVHDLGIDGQGQPFYTMKLVAGITLKQVIDSLKKATPGTPTKYSLSTLLTVFQKVCDALAFAHSRGVIHRDLKPANIMLGKYGEVLVMDWGLAKILGQKAAVTTDQTEESTPVIGARMEEGDGFSTMAGSVMGTPHYMSPEQARGEVDRLDARSDIFALGSILYELLTLERPFAGKHASEIIDKITRVDFIPPALRVPTSGVDRSQPPLPHLPDGRIPTSLNAVVCKAMAGNPAARYADVPALQADITAYQSGFATSAENANPWQLFRLFVRRHKALTSTIAVSLLALILSSSAFTWKVVTERNRAEAGERSAQHQKRVAELNSEAAQLVNVAQTDPEEALIRAMNTVEKSRAILGTVTPSVQYGLAAALEKHRYSGAIKSNIGGARCIAWCDSMRWLAIFGDRNQVEVVDRDRGITVRKIERLGSSIPRSVAISDDGSHIAASEDGPQISVWRSGPSGNEQQTWNTGTDWIRAIQFISNSTRLVSISSKGAVTAWSSTGKPEGSPWQVQLPAGNVGNSAIAPTGRQLVALSDSAVTTDAYAVVLGEPGKAPLVTPLQGHTTNITAIAISNDGDSIATGDSDGLVRIWSIEGKLIAGPIPAQRGVVTGLAFSRDGHSIAVSGADKMLNVFSSKGTLLHGPFPVEPIRGESIAISTDGELIAGLSIYDLLGLQSAPGIPMKSAVADTVCAPDGTRLAALDFSGQFHVWELPSQRPLLRTTMFPQRGLRMAISKDGGIIACASLTGSELKFTDFEGKTSAPSLILEPGETVLSLQFVTETRKIAVVTSKGRIIFHDCSGKSEAVIHQLPVPPTVTEINSTLCRTATGVLLMAGIRGPDRSGRFICYDATGRVLSEVPSDFAIWGGWPRSQTGQVTGPGTQLVWAAGNRLARWPLEQREPRATDYFNLSAPHRITAVQTIDSGTIAAGTDGGSLRFCTSSGEPLTPWLERDAGTMDSLISLAQSTIVVSTGGSARIHFWETNIDRWMQMAAKRLQGSARIREPKSELDRAVAAIIAQQPPIKRSRILSDSALPANKPSQSSASKEELPQGFDAIESTPLAWQIPSGWKKIDQAKITLLDRIGNAMLSDRRTGEFNLIAGFLPEGRDVKQLMAGDSTSGCLLIRLNGGTTPTDLALFSRQGLDKLRKMLEGGQFAAIGTLKPVQPESASTGITTWNTELNTGVWNVQISAANGQPLVMRAYLLPTTKGAYVLAAKVIGTDTDEQLRMTDNLVANLYIPPAVRVDAEYREDLRSEIESRATPVLTAAKFATLSQEFNRLSGAAIAELNAKNFDPAKQLADQALAEVDKLQESYPQDAGKWLLEGTRFAEALSNRLLQFNRHPDVLTYTSVGISKAEAGLKTEQRKEAHLYLLLHHIHRANSLRIVGDYPAARVESQKVQDIMRDINRAGIHPWATERAIDSGLNFVGFALNRADQADADQVLDQVMALQDQFAAGVSYAESLRGLFANADVGNARLCEARGVDALHRRLAQQLAVLDAQLSRNDLKSSQVVVLHRFCAKSIDLVEKYPKADGISAKQLAERCVSWAAVLRKFGPLSPDSESWTAMAEVRLRGKARDRDLPRPTGATARQVDLSGFYTSGLDSPVFGADSRFTLSTLRDGLVALNGVDFDVRGQIQLFGKTMPKEQDAPKSVLGIPIRQKAVTIHVLHATMWSSSDNSSVATYRLHFGDGKTADLPVLYRKDTRDWNLSLKPDQMPSEARVAWKGIGGVGGLGLFQRAYTNPRPEVEIVAMDLISAESPAAPFVVAITLE